MDKLLSQYFPREWMTLWNSLMSQDFLKGQNTDPAFRPLQAKIEDTWIRQNDPILQWIEKLLEPAAGQETTGSIQQEAAQAAREHGIPANIFLAVLNQESGFNPKAIGDGGNSIGMGQVYLPAHPDFDAGKALHGNNGNPDVNYQLAYSARLLKNLYNRYGDWNLAVKHYNGSGPQADDYMNQVMSSAYTRFLPYA